MVRRGFLPGQQVLASLLVTMNRRSERPAFDSVQPHTRTSIGIRDCRFHRFTGSLPARFGCSIGHLTDRCLSPGLGATRSERHHCIWPLFLDQEGNACGLRSLICGVIRIAESSHKRAIEQDFGNGTILLDGCKRGDELILLLLSHSVPTIHRGIRRDGSDHHAYQSLFI